MKRQIMDEICSKLDELDIPYRLFGDDRLAAAADFYEIDGGPSFRRVRYGLLVRLDEQSRAVLAYFRTQDQRLLSLGALQRRPVSIFRKLRRLRQGDGGQLSVATVDLGEVMSAVKDAAARRGWRFSATLSLCNLKAEPELKPPPSVPADDFALLPEIPEAQAVWQRRTPKGKKPGLFARLFGRFRRQTGGR